MKIKDGLLVALGGAIGATLRYIIDSSFVTTFEYGKLLSLLTINTVGSFILGYLTTRFVLKKHGIKLQLLLGTGLCGSFTTMSSFSGASFILLASNDHVFYGLAYIAVSTLLGIGAAWIGLMTGKKKGTKEMEA